MNNKPNWHRVAALEFAGRLYAGRGFDRLPDLEAAYDWALHALQENPEDEEPEPKTGGWVGPPNLPDDAVPVTFGPPTTGKFPASLGTVLDSIARTREAIVRDLGGPAVRLVAEGPPRNVPIEGDGSITVPVYRFWVEDRSDWDRPYVRYWREDTRNETNRWSMWADDQRWFSSKAFDLSRPSNLQRVRKDELPHYVAIETRHDTEE